MKRIKLLLPITLLLLTTICIPVYATGLLEIDPTWPTMTDAEETFEIWVKNGGTAYDPQLLLVMTETCYDDLNEVTIDFNKDTSIDETLDINDFTEAVLGEDVPPSYPPGIKYTVASLKDHLGISGTEWSVYWTTVEFPDGENINGPTSKYRVHIKLDSSDPAMLVYVYAKSDPDLDDYDMRIPTTNPGFMVPEPATIAAVATPTLTLLAYAYHKRKTIFS